MALGSILEHPEALVLIIAVIAFFMGGVIKGAMGFGLPILAIPAMTAAHSLPMALSIAVLPVAATNIWQLWCFRHSRHEAPFMPGFLIAGTVGLLVGGIALSVVREAFLEIALGGSVLLYLLQRIRKNPGRSSRPAPAKIAPAIGALAGAVHGATGLSGLVGTPYLHALGLTRPVFVFCNGAMFSLFSILHAPALWALGLYQPQAIWMGALALPAAFVGFHIGGWAGTKLNSNAFSSAVLIILGSTAIIPIWNGMRDILTG